MPCTAASIKMSHFNGKTVLHNIILTHLGQYVNYRTSLYCSGKQQERGELLLPCSFLISLDYRVPVTVRTVTPGSVVQVPSVFRVKVAPGTVMFRSERELELALKNGILKSEIDTHIVAADICTIIKGCVFEWCLNDSMNFEETIRRILKRYFESIFE